MPHAPHPKGARLPRIKRLPITGWDEQGNFTVTFQVNPKPGLSPSKKCYMFAFENCEIDKLVNIGGVERKVRMTFMLYAKVPASERHAALEQEAKRLEAEGTPRLY